MKKKMNNKGFSLVELIIVIAIMAVLMVVLAPQLLKYVEKTRLQKDNSAISEIANAIKVACADEKIINNIPSTGVKFETNDGEGTVKEFTFSATAATGTTLLENELASVIGTSVKTSSTSYRDSDVKISIQVTSDGKVSVVGFIEEVGGTATTETNARVF